MVEDYKHLKLCKELGHVIQHKAHDEWAWGSNGWMIHVHNGMPRDSRDRVED